jgi:hypothetical protein
MSKTIANHMKEIMIEQNMPIVWYGDILQLHECANRSGLKSRSKSPRGNHPLNIITKVLNALDKSSLFEKQYIRHLGRLCRAFKLIKEVE